MRLSAARLALGIDKSIYKSINGLYTFGQPRVGNRVFVKALDDEIKSQYFRFVKDNDIVPRVPDRLNQYQEGGSIPAILIMESLINQIVINLTY